MSADFDSLIIDAVPNLVVALDRQGRIIRFNRACEQLSGYRQVDVLGRCLIDLLLPPEDAGDARAELGRVFDGAAPSTCEYEWVIRDGRRRRIAWSGAAARGAAGNVEYVVATGIDVTDRIGHDRDVWWRNVVETAHVGISIIDAQGRLTFVNQRLVNMVGYTVNEVVGQPFYRFMDEALWPLARERLERRRAGVRESYELPLRHKDGAQVWTLVSTNPLLDERGKFVASLGMVSDITEWKRAEQALRFGEELNRRVLEAVPGGIVRVGADGAVLSANEGAQHFLGYRLDPARQIYVSNFRGRTIREDGTDFPVEEYPVSRCLATGQPQPAATLGVVRPDGQIFWGMFSATPMMDARTAKPSGAVVTFLDITARKKAEETVRASEELFRASFEDAAIGMSLTDLEGRFVRVNKAYSALTGYSEQELRGLTFLDITHPDDHEANRAFARRLISGEISHAIFEKRYLTRQGRPVWVHASISVVRGPDGRPVNMIALMEDISERKLAQEALRESEQRFRQLAEAIDGVFWIVDAGRHRMLYVSPAYEQIWGKPPDELRRHPGSFIDSIVPEDRPQMLAAMEQMNEEGFDIEYRILRPDGTTIWVRDRAYPICDEQGRVYRVCGIAENVTERKRTEQAIQAMNEHLERLVAERTAAVQAQSQVLRESERHYRELAEHNRRLVQEVEHRVRNNLAGLLGLLSVMQDRVTDVKTFARAMEGRLRAMAHVHQLLATTEWRSPDLRHLIESAIASMSLMAPAQAELALDGPPLSICPKRVLPLTLILAEWFTNSCKYGAHSRSGCRVSVSWENANGNDGRGRQVRLIWQEHGGPPPARPVTPSLGSELVNAFATRELEGSCQMDYPDAGARHVLEFSLDKDGR